MLFICKQTFPLLSVYIGYHVVTTAQGYNSSSSRSPGESFMTNDSMTASSIKPLPQDFASNATFAALLAPLYHTVTAGEAWVFPSSAKDLGARDMSCECFNPKGMISLHATYTFLLSDC